MSKIFISYRREDSQNITDRIYDHLKRNYQSDEVFKDVNSIPVGTAFPEYISKSIQGAEVVLFIIGKHWCNAFSERIPEKDFVRQEVLEAQRSGKKIIPVFVEGVKHLNENDLPDDLKFIAKINATVVRPDPDFEHDLQNLIQKINDNLTTKNIYKPEQKTSFINPKLLIFLLLLLAAGGGYWYWTTRETCDYPKKGVLIANFLNKEHDGFANTVVTSIDNVLPDSIYDVRPVGAQSREVKNYAEVIEKTHFDSDCQPAGIFVNGFIDKEDKVFNLYANIVKMDIKYPELITDNKVTLSNPESVEFSIREDAKFVADFILAIIAMYDGNTQQALKTLTKLEINQKVNLKDPEFMATVAFYKGNCYAIDGDEKKAQVEYKKAKNSENPALVNHALRNSGKADVISESYQKDPEYADVRLKNIEENTTLENEILNILGLEGKTGKGKKSGEKVLFNDFEKELLKTLIR